RGRRRGRQRSEELSAWCELSVGCPHATFCLAVWAARRYRNEVVRGTKRVPETIDPPVMFDDYPGAARLLAAIRKAPDEVSKRSAFADWLEKRGEARAGWLRDPEIWPWMAPDVHDPVPGLLAVVFE